MVRWELGKGKWQEGRRYLAPYCGLDPETVDWKFLENNYSTPRQMNSNPTEGTAQLSPDRVPGTSYSL